MFRSQKARKVIYRERDAVLWGLMLLLAIVFLGFEYDRQADFLIYLQASSDLLAGVDIYHTLYGSPKVFPYMGSPFLAFLISPSTFSFSFGSVFLKLISLLLLVRIWKLMEMYFVAFCLTNKQHSLFVFLSFVAMSFLIYRNFHMVQFTVFLLYSILESVHQISNKKNALFGVSILGVGILTKLLPIVLVPYLCYRGYWKSVILLIVSLTVLVLLPAVFLGWERNIVLNQDWLHSISPLNEQNIFDVSTRTIHGIAALISTLTIEGIGNFYSLSLKRNIIDLNPETVRIIILSVKIVFVLITLYFLKSQKIFTDHHHKTKQFWELSYILLAAPLIFPQQRSYAFLFPALTYLMFCFVKYSENRRLIPVTFFIVGIFLLNLDLLIGHFREYFWHFKTMTYGVLILLGLLIWMSPEKMLFDRKNELSN